MANKRIRELDTMTIGTGGTAASSVFLAVDPNSGTTSKVSLEDAVAGTAALNAGSGGAVGIPSIAHSAGFRTALSGTKITVANLFATNTTVFGNLYYSNKLFTNDHITLTKTKGNNSVMLSYGGHLATMRSKTVGAGTPQLTHDGARVHFVSSGGKYGQRYLTVSFWSNGFFFSHAGLAAYQIMYWPG